MSRLWYGSSHVGLGYVLALPRYVTFRFSTKPRACERASEHVTPHFHAHRASHRESARSGGERAVRCGRAGSLGLLGRGRGGAQSAQRSACKSGCCLSKLAYLPAWWTCTHVLRRQGRSGLLALGNRCAQESQAPRPRMYCTEPDVRIEYSPACLEGCDVLETASVYREKSFKHTYLINWTCGGGLQPLNCRTARRPLGAIHRQRGGAKGTLRDELGGTERSIWDGSCRLAGSNGGTGT